MRLEPAKTKQTVKQHLKELRNRFFVCIAVLIASGIGIYFFYEPIIRILSSTLGSELYYNTPAGGFSFVMRICTTGAIVFTVPVIIYNVIKFLKPAFENILTTKRVFILSVCSTIFALVGAAFAYFLILPESLNFFSGFNISGLNALISADDYLSFVISMIAVFAIIFQVPMLMLLADSIKRIPPSKMLKNEIWVILASVIIAIITPFNYDVLSSLVIAMPIIGLYNLSIIIIGFRHLSSNIRQKATKRAIVIKPSDVEDFVLSDLEFSAMKEAITSLELTAPVQPAPIVKKVVAMDFKVRTIKNAQIEQAQLRQLQQRRLAQITQSSPRVRVFSDIMPRRTSHVLASQ